MSYQLMLNYPVGTHHSSGRGNELVSEMGNLLYYKLNGHASPFPPPHHSSSEEEEEENRQLEMGRVTMLLLVLAVFLVVFASEVEGGRSIKSNVKAYNPQTFFGGFGGSIPGAGSFPGQGMGGGSFPGRGGTGFIFSPPSFCSFTGIGCTSTRPTIPGGAVGGGGSGSPP